jgi:hypothetical protein
MTNIKNRTIEDWQEACAILLENTHDRLLDDLEDSVAHQSDRLMELGNATDKEIRAAVNRGLKRSLQPVDTRTPEDIAAGVYRDSQGRG